MERKNRFWCLVSVFAVSFYVTKSQKKVEESNTGALLKFPSVMDGPLYGKEWEVSPAQFGYQSYGGSVEAYMIIPHNISYHTECPDSNNQEPLNINQYIHWLNDVIDPDDQFGFIFVVDRGDCYFVEKVEFAQAAGARACLIIDHTPEHLFTMWMPDNWKDDIDIPSVLLGETNGETLMKHIGVQGWDPKNIKNTVYPSPQDYIWTLATIEWGLPHDDDRVEWELWTSSNDPLGSTFKRNFKPISLLLDGANDTVFTPHMYILNGTHWGCDKYPDLRCGNQCSNQGRYCSVDPEYDLDNGISGIDVVQENVRNLCVWNYTKYKDELNHNLDETTWWDYSVLWDEECAVFNKSIFNGPIKFTEECSFRMMDIVDHTKKLKEYVQNCIQMNGGYGYNDSVNAILESEVKLREKNGVYALPMVRVNEFLIHGNIDCEELTPDGCEVLAAICAGFMEGTQPDICKSLSPTLRPSESPKCQIDACGDCKFIWDETWDSCKGCDQVINSGKKLNPCNICMDEKEADFDSFGKDCAGICDGRHEMDQCDQCLLTDHPDYNNCIYQKENDRINQGQTLDINLIIIIAVIVLIIIVVVVFSFCKMRKNQQNLEHKLAQIAGSYEFMNDDPESTNVNIRETKKSKKTKSKIAVKTEEEEDQVL